MGVQGPVVAQGQQSWQPASLAQSTLAPPGDWLEAIAPASVTHTWHRRWMKARGNRDKIILATKVMGGGSDPRSFVRANRYA